MPIPAVAVLLYAIASPKQSSRAAYVASWMSKARQTAPILRSMNSLRRGALGMPRSPIGLTLISQRRAVIGTALHEVWQPIVLLDPEVQLVEVLRDLGRGVAHGAGVVREHDDRQL